jgi:hypothetical protein
VYLSFNKGIVLHYCSDLKIITDLLFIEQRKEFTIQPTDSSVFLAKCSTTDIFKIYLGLGGDSSSFKTAAEVVQARQQLIQKCRELVLARKRIKYNGFEIEMQAIWLERRIASGLEVCGYKYSVGSNVPSKV